MIRRAVPGDRQRIVILLEPWMAKYPLRQDYGKVKDALTFAMSDANSFVWVSENDCGNLCGVIIGLGSDNLWAQRKHNQLVAWISHLPGDGEKLLRQYVKWVDERPVIRYSGLVPDLDGIDSRALALAERMGFRRRGSALVRYRGDQNGAV